MNDYDRILGTALNNYAVSFEASVVQGEPFIAWLESPERKRLREIGPIHGPERPTMIVSELIAELRALPQDAEVWTSDEGLSDPYPHGVILVTDGRVFV